MTRLRRITAGATASAAILALAACSGTSASTQAPAAAAPAAPHQAVAAAAPAPEAATPVAVNCGAGFQALIRPGVVNGQSISQVDCVPVGRPAQAMQPVATAPAWYGDSVASLPGEPPVVYERPAPRPAARPVTYRTAQYEPPRETRSGRSWKKSAVIIGSSAGVGAGVGAAVGGKKGALIGAAVGGGSAAIWDQATRR